MVEDPMHIEWVDSPETEADLGTWEDLDFDTVSEAMKFAQEMYWFLEIADDGYLDESGEVQAAEIFLYATMNDVYEGNYIFSQPNVLDDVEMQTGFYDPDGSMLIFDEFGKLEVN